MAHSRSGGCAVFLALGIVGVAQVGVANGQSDRLPPPADHPILKSPSSLQLGDLLKGKTLTIRQAVGLALVTNRSLALVRAYYYSSIGRTKEVESTLNPTLGAAAEVLRLNDTVLNKSLTVLDPKTLGQPIGVDVATSNIQQQLFSITANEPVDISGTLRAAVDQAKYQQLAYLLDVNRVRNQVVASVKSAFYDVLRAEGLQTVAQENLKNTQDRLKDAQDRLSARVVTKFDVLRAQTDVAAAQQQLIVAENTVRTDLAILNEVIGIKVNDPIQVSTDGAVSEPASGPSPTGMTADGLGPEFDGDLREALADRPEIQQATAVISAANKGITVARRSDLPSLNLSWSYLYAPNAGGTTPVVHSWAAEALFSVPIFDGGLARGRMQEAKGNVAAANVEKRDAVDQVTLEAEQAYLAVNEARQRVTVANATLDEAKQAFALAQVRYKAGVSARAGISPLLELSDAQSALTLAETNQVNALYDYNSSNARLDRALGRYSKP